jgi:CYTH domain-containing protein/CHAD domain-containing protein
VQPGPIVPSATVTFDPARCDRLTDVVGYVIEPGRRTQREVRRIAAERLGDAIEHLDGVLADPEHADLETAIHEARKRCKASRGLARLVVPALGEGFRSFDKTVRNASNQLSTFRDAQAVLNTFDALIAARPDDEILRSVRHRQAAMSAAAARSAVAVDDDRISTARALLDEALDASQGWKIPRGFETLEAALATTYRDGRSALRRVRKDPNDRRVHEWRKSVKYLWYQVQLLHDAAPSVLGPLEKQLDALAEALGDDHDLAVLVQLLDDHPDDYGTAGDVAHVRTLARDRQSELRAFSVRAGSTIYAESGRAFAHRIARYWDLTVELGPEPDKSPHEQEPPPRPVVERERKFLVDDLPDDLVATTVVTLRQGYLASEPYRSVRVRDAGSEGCTLTVKAGGGAERTEIELPIQRTEFDAAWPHTEGRRLEKERRRIPCGEHVIELDVFGGDLDGLVMAEVEFDSVDAMESFEPPDWFGLDVTDDDGYTNASLALRGLPTADADADADDATSA